MSRRFCSVTGHPAVGADNVCRYHGAPIFSNCPRCAAAWPAVDDTSPQAHAADWCANCPEPARWVQRREIIQAFQAHLHLGIADGALRVHLEGVLDKLARMEADDARTLAGWDEIRGLAPELWRSYVKPILSRLVVHWILENWRQG